MKETKRKRRLVALWMVGVLAVSCVPVSAAHFRDMSAAHWAYASIEWAAEEGIVGGYEDGTFQPSRMVSEAEFLVMYMHYFFNMKSVPTGNLRGEHWASSYYTTAVDLHIPFQGGSYKDRPIRRGLVARTVTKALGYDYSEKQAVEWLLKKEIVTGRTPGNATYASYAPDEPLTRAEAAQFFKTLHRKGYTRFITN
ncbi:hypothetical protein AM501_07260 [Aneurinibacillus migulanus]|uniref:S-layer homology domain-containing protein n=1 Tax=Aneurinibacillus migulanus TaxID=47500 RepID=A0A0D1Y376_ANEMI|nr:S-layer homology domain-containing protein [Aneurinibacillus migulanus]KIV53737.1 hypothetical protein TS64_17535 [Aneurinibacillus migulanus]KIV58690.1 hypothetical protein TS65_04750 [Aneurinibacillus migulanus]KON96380.1 hypothetical protein AF333_13740 [Aneurinibacillus migulanus]KPD08905.1 hypothetical protein AM501_07260 [Aneurinibacillus migulanus]MCP1356833.1 S-layer homology domain-containing protein [Aneurinibacillus migulanus]